MRSPERLQQVLIALVVTFDGFPLGYEVFSGWASQRACLTAFLAALRGGCEQ